MDRKRQATILTILWLTNLLVALLVLFTPLSLRPFRLFYLQLSLILTGIPLITWYIKRTNEAKWLAICTLLVANTSIAVYYVFLDWRGEWKTQSIEYQNLQLVNRTIEFQLQDIGARGYHRRFVDRIKILPFLEWTKEVEIDSVDASSWLKVDIYVNEMGLKGG